MAEREPGALSSEELASGETNLWDPPQEYDATRDLPPPERWRKLEMTDDNGQTRPVDSIDESKAAISHAWSNATLATVRARPDQWERKVEELREWAWAYMGRLDVLADLETRQAELQQLRENVGQVTAAVKIFLDHVTEVEKAPKAEEEYLKNFLRNYLQSIETTRDEIKTITDAILQPNETVDELKKKFLLIRRTLIPSLIALFDAAVGSVGGTRFEKDIQAVLGAAQVTDILPESDTDWLPAYHNIVQVRKGGKSRPETVASVSSRGYQVDKEVVRKAGVVINL